MLPRSCLRWAVSKSNSSTRLPRTTTTRVSSGWVASINILLGILELMTAAGAYGGGRISRPRGTGGPPRFGGGGEGKTPPRGPRRTGAPTRKGRRRSGSRRWVAQHREAARDTSGNIAVSNVYIRGSGVACKGSVAARQHYPLFAEDALRSD